MAGSSIQRVVQSTTPAPTFGQLFGQALVRSVGAPVRQAREERAEFLKIAPALIQQKLITPTTGDDPDSISFGNKKFSFGGVSFKSTAPKPSLADQKTALQIEKLAFDRNNRGNVSKGTLEDFYFSEFGPASLIQEEFFSKINNEKDPKKRAQLVAERDGKIASGSTNFIARHLNDPQSVSVNALTGQIQFLVKDGKRIRPMTPDELKNGTSLPSATQSDIDKGIDLNAETEQPGDIKRLVGQFAGGVSSDVSSNKGSLASKILLGGAAVSKIGPQLSPFAKSIGEGARQFGARSNVGSKALQASLKRFGSQGVARTAVSGAGLGLGVGAGALGAGLSTVAGPIAFGAAAGDLIGNTLPLPSQGFTNRNQRGLEAIAGFPFNLFQNAPQLGPAVTGQR